MKNAIKDIVTATPFNLDAAAREWVQTTFANLTNQEKICQLFNLIAFGAPTEIANTNLPYNLGGITRIFSSDFAAEQSAIADLQAQSKVPLLISSDLEGSIMSLPFGTEVPNPLALAAIDNVESTKLISDIMAMEARAVGINWSFTPVLDINETFRSSIVATRGYGNNLDRIERHAMVQLQRFQAAGLAATVKHWPGEGYDDRDQHLVTTINPQNMAEWRDTFGRLYLTAIKNGVKSVMSAHIALPAYMQELGKHQNELEAYRPASINNALNQQLLRDELGFNGLIVSDATTMAGLGSWSTRSDFLPQVIENGCDMILFSDNPTADFEYLNEALKNGKLSQERVDLAVYRILALKASLSLRSPQESIDLPELETSAKIVQQITAKAPTLVKDVQNILPLNLQNHKRVYVYTTGLISPIFGTQDMSFIEMLRDEGFEVTVHDANKPGLRLWQNSDLVLYIMGEETLLTRERIFMNWNGLTGFFGAAMERPWHEKDCALISFGYPYYLYDAPRMPCVVNAYMVGDSMQKAALNCLMGRTEWFGKSPVDPFCGLVDAKF